MRPSHKHCRRNPNGKVKVSDPFTFVPLQPVEDQPLFDQLIEQCVELPQRTTGACWNQTVYTMLRILLVPDSKR